MASQNLNVGTSANSNDGDTLRGAFIKLKKMFAEVYGQTYSEQGDLSGTDFKINESKLQLTASGTASDDGKVLTYDHATGGFSWEDAFSGTIGDITGIVAGFGLTGSSLDENEATLNVVAGTGITVTADAVSLATSVQSEISANTSKTGITATQASEIAANTLKDTDQTVVLNEGDNITITGTYPNFTIASDDVVGAVTSVNGDDGVVVLDTSDVAENTNLYYTEARVSANADVAANTLKTGITSAQAAEIAANTLKDTDQTVTLTEGANVTITGTYPNFTIASEDVVGAVNSVNGDTGVVVLDTDDVSEGTSNLYDKTVTLTEGANVTITGTYPDFTIASDDVVGAVTSVNGAAGVVVLDTSDVAENTNLYYTDARVEANSAVALNTAKTGITTAQADDITANNAKVSNATHTGDVTGDVALTIEDNVVNAAKLDVTGNGTAGQLLQSDGDGSMTWVTGVTGDITAVTAGNGLTGGGTGGDVTLNVVGGAGITASADEISLSANVAGAGMTYVNGVLNVNTIGTDGIVNDAVDGTKLAQFDDTLSAATTGDILVSNGTDFIQAAMSGDATIVAGGAITIADDAIDATKLNVADNGTSGQLLKSDGDGSFSWVNALAGDVEAIVAGAGLTGTDLDGPTPTLNVIAGDGISVTADAVSLDSAVAGDGLTFTSGVLSVDDLDASNIADDAITPSQINIFDDASVATDTHILIADGTSFSNYVMSGDATLANTGAITIADDAIDTDKILDDAVTADKLADSINADIATGVAKVDFPGFGNTTGTALEGDTALLQLGTSNTTALAGDTRVITSGEISEIAANTLKVSNVTTDLGITGTTGARDITSSDGTDATIPVASTSESGLMSKAIFDEHELNNAKAAGTVTDLGKTVSGTGFTITSSDGADVDLSLADTNNWGLMSDEMFDAQVLNTAKITNSTHTGEVTGSAGSDALTITDGAVVADRIAADAVTTDKILDANVTTAKIADDAVDAAKLNVSGNGNSGQVLSSDGDGSFSWTTSSSGGYSAVYASTAITSWTSNTVYIFTNTSAVTHTLPSSPSVGTSFKMSLRGTGTNTLGRNGNSIMGLSEDLVLDDLTAAFELFYAGGAQGWVIIGAN